MTLCKRCSQAHFTGNGEDVLGFSWIKLTFDMQIEFRINAQIYPA
jgi:hypothetical protein